MTFEFKHAVRENTPIIIGIAGASGSGKTYSALELATGLAGPSGKIAVIDTEGRRALHYADTFEFAHGEWRPPFSPDRLLEALQSAERAGFRVIVVDSASDEHEGEGGLIDMAGAGRSQNSAANWAAPKAAHKKVIRWLRQARCHVVFCFRAEEKVRLEKVYNEQKQREETVIVPLGWQPVCEKRFMFEMTASFLMAPASPGLPQPIKLQEQHRSYFPADKTITRAAGRMLADWAAGAAAKPPAAALVRFGEAADRGEAALRDEWGKATKAERDEVRDKIGTAQAPGDLLKRAIEADRKRAAPQDDPFDTDPFGGKPPSAPDRPAGSPPSTVPVDDAGPFPAPPGEPAPEIPGSVPSTARKEQDKASDDREPRSAEDRISQQSHNPIRETAPRAFAKILPRMRNGKFDWDTTRDLLLEGIGMIEDARDVSGWHEKQESTIDLLPSADQRAVLRAITEKERLLAMGDGR